MSADVYFSLDEVRSRLAAGDGTQSLGEMLVSLSADPVERAVVEALAVDAVRDGGFRDPVIVVAGESGAVIADGRHRIAAHFLTGVSPVKVRYGYPLIDPDDVFVRVTYRLSGATVDGMPLRSFPVDDGWAVADVAAVLSSDPPVVSYSYWAHGLAPERVASAGVDAARARGFDAEVLAVDLDSPWE